MKSPRNSAHRIRPNRLFIRTRKITLLIASLLIAACLATLPASMKAQQVVVGNTDKVSGSAIQVIDLQKNASAEEVTVARTAYQQGHIIRMTEGTPADIRKATGAEAFEIRPAAADQKSAAPMAGTNLSAVRLGQHGELHQFAGTNSNQASRSSFQLLEASFEQWRQKQQQEAVGDPSGPPQSWQQVLEVTFVQSGNPGDSSYDWGSIQNIITAYRLSAASLDGEYYMVLTDPTTAPNFKVPASNCASLFLAPCGWYTTHRNISISTTPSGILFDHGPTTQITNGSGSWTIGLGIPGSGSVGYSQNWSQSSVTTTDQSNLATGVGQWDEAFTSETCCAQLPATSVSTFLSHQGAIFKLSPGTASFQLNIGINTQIIYQPSFGNPYGGAGNYQLTGTVSPPQFAVNPTAITIAPGASATVQVVANIGAGQILLPWVVENIPLWLNVSQIKGAGSTLVTLTANAGTALGTLGTLNFDTVPSYASPAVAAGPLTMNVKVGQPDLHGVLVAGGSTRVAFQDTASNTGLLYSAEKNQFTGVSQLHQPRTDHTATPLDDGSILIAGGLETSNDYASAIAAAEIYDPSTGNFSPLATACPGAKGCMVTPASLSVATKLANGKVLITGGYVSGQGCSSAAEIYDPATQIFTAVQNMLSPRYYHTATLLPNGEVLIMGGLSNLAPNIPATTAELFDPGTNSFRLANNPAYPMYAGTGTQSNGGVLFTGGATNTEGALASAQLYSVASGMFQAIAGMNQARAFHTATPLPDGKVLIAGGRDNSLSNVDTAEIFDPGSQTFTLVSGSGSCPGAAGCMLTPRSYHQATALPDGRVFLSGGLSGDYTTTLQSTEIFDPATMNFSAGPTFDGRFSHTSTVVRDATKTAIQSSPNPSAAGQQVTLSATVTVPGSGSSSGTVMFYDGQTALGTMPVANGTATLKVSFELGQHSITAAYGGNQFYGPSTSSPRLQQVNISPTSLSLTSSPNPVPFGAPVTFTANLTRQGATAATGNVSFLDNGGAIGTVAIANGAAKLAVGTLNSGRHQITAAYTGDSNYAPSDSNTLLQTVTGVVSQVTLSSSANPAPFGGSVVFTANVVVPSTPGTVPTGRVTFADAGTPIGSTELKNASAVLTTNQLASGKHQITAVYSGDNTYALSTSPALTQVVNSAQTQTNTTLSSSPNPSVQGQAVVFTATVNPTAATTNTPTGHVTFLEGSTTLGAGTLATQGGVQVAVFSTSALAVGTHVITAAYGGDTNFTRSTSLALTQTVSPSGGGKVTPTVSLTVNGSTSATVSSGATVTFLARVHAAPGYPWPNGSITISDSTNANNRYGSAIITKDPNSNDGLATITNSGMAVGSYMLVATYGGDDQGKYYNGAPSNTVSLKVLSGLGSPPPHSIVIRAAIGLRNGTEVPLSLTVTNNGTAPASAITLSQITFHALVGAGTATLVSPSLPLHEGNLQPGQSLTIPLILEMPATVSKLALTEQGTSQDARGTVYQFSTGQVVFP